MAAERIVIVGGGPAGLSTARGYRAAGGSGAVTIVGEEPLLPYERPPLTKGLLRGESDVDSLPLEPTAWFEEQAVDLRLGTAVTAIEPAAGRVRLGDGSDLAADAIVLATGAEPVPPPIAGLGHPRVVAIRRMPDSLRVRELAREGSAVVVGGGFIASEAAASLATQGAAVTLIDQEPLPQRSRVGDEVAERIAAWLRDLGVEHIGGARVIAVHDGRVAVLADGRRVQGACTVLATGVRPRSELAAAAGLAIESGFVLVDEHMRVAATDGRVLAVGDVALAHNATAGRRIHIEHWGDALGEGAVAGRVLGGDPVAWDEVPGFWTTIGEHTLKFAGWGEGFDDVRFAAGPGGDFAARYSRDGVLVGVLSHGRDAEYDEGRRLIASAAREA